MNKAEIERIREALSSTDKWPMPIKKAEESRKTLKSIGNITTIGSGILFLVVMFKAAGGFHLGGFLISLVGIALLYGMFWIINWFANRNVMKTIDKWRTEQAEEAAYQLQRHALVFKAKLYHLCKKNGVSELSTPAQTAKAKVILEQNGYPVENLKADFEVSRKAYLELDRICTARNNRINLNNLRVDEKKCHRELTRYAYLTGRDKRVQMLLDEAAELHQKAKKLGKKMEDYQNLGIKKEQDWAVAGGIASGLAGGAAGVATALEIQQKNAEIRQSNEKMKAATMPVVIALHHEYADTIRKAEQMEQEAEAAKLKVVLENSGEAALKALHIENTAVEISDSGAFIVTALVSCPKPVYIYDTIPAVVDGSIRAALYQNGNCAGSAVMVLPTRGIGEKSQLKGICLEGAQKDVPYEIRFAQENLWLMEE